MRVHRLLSIILILTNKKSVTASELANHFEVSLRTIYRDMDKISEAGVPIAAHGGHGGGYYIMDPYSVKDLFFNKGEMQTVLSLVDGLQILFGNNQQFNDILMKCQHSLDDDRSEDVIKINMSHFSMSEELAGYLSIMNKAIEEKQVLAFYYINRKFNYEERIIEPMRITFSSGEWFLEGFCRVRQNYRRFKFTRIKELHTNGQHYVPNRSIADMETGFHKSYEINSIELKLHFRERIGKQLAEHFYQDSIEKVDDGYLVTDVLPNDEGLIKFILGFGQDCRVLYPIELRDKVKIYMIGMLETYDLDVDKS